MDTGVLQEVIVPTIWPVVSNKGQLSVTQTFVNGWAWWFIMPNYTFQLVCLYLGLVEVFLVATLSRPLAAQTHVN